MIDIFSHKFGITFATVRCVNTVAQSVDPLTAIDLIVDSYVSRKINRETQILIVDKTMQQTVVTLRHSTLVVFSITGIRNLRAHLQQIFRDYQVNIELDKFCPSVSVEGVV